MDLGLCHIIVYPEQPSTCQALIARNIIPDYCEPRILGFGITPLYMRYGGGWDCMDIITDIMDFGSWQTFLFDTEECCYLVPDPAVWYFNHLGHPYTIRL